MKPFKCDIALIVGDDAYPFTTYFSDHFAVEFMPAEEHATVYDLESMWWVDAARRRTVTIKDCERWANASANMSRQSLANSTDKNLNRFVELTLDPQLEVTDDDDAVALTNDVFSYRVTCPIALDELRSKRFFAYDRLNAYRKAMTDRKLPPFAQLAVDAELERRGFVPGAMDLAVRTPNGELKLKVALKIGSMTEAETTRVQTAIRGVTGTEPSRAAEAGVESPGEAVGQE